ncbi:MAG: hypothetical protein KGI52_18580 [Burkholderiales bacterium]|nr:hypothetical protein [Burkholderiales bacterium]
MNYSYSLALAHLVGFMGAWIWFTRDKSSRKEPLTLERNRWMKWGLLALLVEQALLAIATSNDWSHLPLSLTAFAIGGFMAIVILIGIPKPDQDDDTPMSYAELTQLSIAAGTCFGSIAAFAAMLWFKPLSH